MRGKAAFPPPRLFGWGEASERVSEWVSEWVSAEGASFDCLGSSGWSQNVATWRKCMQNGAKSFKNEAKRRPKWANLDPKGSKMGENGSKMSSKFWCSKKVGSRTLPVVRGRSFLWLVDWFIVRFDWLYGWLIDRLIDRSFRSRPSPLHLFFWIESMRQATGEGQN